MNSAIRFLREVRSDFYGECNQKILGECDQIQTDNALGLR
jgi:hypothetical protein